MLAACTRLGEEGEQGGTHLSTHPSACSDLYQLLQSLNPQDTPKTGREEGQPGTQKKKKKKKTNLRPPFGDLEISGCRWHTN
jgi:hypothetical protein